MSYCQVHARPVCSMEQLLLGRPAHLCARLCPAAYAGMMIAQQGSHFAGSFFGALLPILNQWLINANASYTAMTSLLSRGPRRG